MSRERRRHPRLESDARILWSVVGTHDLQIDRLRDVSAGGALVATESLAKVGDEIRFDLLDDDGEKFGSGLARVTLGRPGAGDGHRVPRARRRSGARRDARYSRGPRQGAAAPPAAAAGARGVPLPPGELAREPAVDDGEADDDAVAPQVEPLVGARTGVIIGIDLGTTNTCASYVVDGRPAIIPGRTGTNTIPSMITFDPDGTFHVGQRAADRQILYPLRTVYGSKRLVGRTYRAELAAELQQHFAYPARRGRGPALRRAHRRPRRQHGHHRRARPRGGAQHGRGAPRTSPSRRRSSPCPPTSARCSARPCAGPRREAKLVVHRIVNEPTAAAVAYGHKQGSSRARVAVWDFGGGTFDFSIVDVTDGQLEVVATGGDNFVGGSDFDDLLASHLLGEFQRMQRASRSTPSRSRSRGCARPPSSPSARSRCRRSASSSCRSSRAIRSETCASR